MMMQKVPGVTDDNDFIQERVQGTPNLIEYDDDDDDNGPAGELQKDKCDDDDDNHEYQIFQK